MNSSVWHRVSILVVAAFLLASVPLFWGRIRNRPNTYPFNVDSIDAKLGNLIGYDRIYIVRARGFFWCWSLRNGALF